MTSSEITEGLRACELFGSLSEEEIQRLVASLATECEVKDYEAGASIFPEGEYNRKLYIIVEGQVLLERSINLGDRTAIKPLSLLRKGKAIGWSALLFGPRHTTASAVCQKPTQVISLEGTSLRSVLDKEPGIGYKVMERLACLLGDRLRAAYSALETHL